MAWGERPRRSGNDLLEGDAPPEGGRDGAGSGREALRLSRGVSCLGHDTILQTSMRRWLRL